MATPIARLLTPYGAAASFRLTRRNPERRPAPSGEWRVAPAEGRAYVLAPTRIGPTKGALR
jgi:hypothetical protein